MEAQTQTNLTNQSNPTYATYNDFAVSRLTCTIAEQKTIPTTGQGQNGQAGSAGSYWQIPLMYNYGPEDKKQLNDFLFEACELETRFGVQSKTQNGRTDYSIMCTFDNNNAEHIKCLDAFEKIHVGCAFILQQMKGTVKMPQFNPNMAEATGLKYPVYYPMDTVTCARIPGRAPSMFFKLFKRGKAPMEEKTLFTDVHGKPIPWELLNGVEMRFIPLLHVKRMYIGNKQASIQMEMQSAIVTSIRARGSSTKQVNTIDRLKSARPELADMVSQQLAKLTLERQETLLAAQEAATPPPESTQQGQPQTTFSGITRPGGLGSGPAMVPALNGQQMHEMLASAPNRLPVIPTVAIPGVTDTGVHSPSTLQLN